MRTDRPRRFFSWILVALAVLVLVNGFGSAEAMQNAPAWAPGNHWTYGSTSFPNSTQTLTVDRVVNTTVASRIRTFTYTTWHAWNNLTTTSSSGTNTFTINLWLTTDGLKLVKTESVYPSSGTVTSTYSPPAPALVFPLSPGSSWTGNSSVTTTTMSGTNTTTVSWGGRVISEGPVTVPAGNFTAEVVRIATTDGSFALIYYSEVAGWPVKQESYDSGDVLMDTLQLTSYSYAPAPVGGLGPYLYWIALVVVVVAGLIVAPLFLRSRRRASSSGEHRDPPEQPPGGASGPPPGPP